MGLNYLSISKLQQLRHWGMIKWACDYLSILGLKLNLVSKRSPSWLTLPMQNCLKKYEFGFKNSVTSLYWSTQVVKLLMYQIGLLLYFRKMKPRKLADILQATFSILFTCMGRRVLRLYLNYFSLMAHWRSTGHRPLFETGWCNLLMPKCVNWTGLIKESVNNIDVKPMFSKSQLGKLKTSCWYIIRRIFLLLQITARICFVAIWFDRRNREWEDSISFHKFEETISQSIKW